MPAPSPVRVACDVGPENGSAPHVVRPCEPLESLEDRVAALERFEHAQRFELAERFAAFERRFEERLERAERHAREFTWPQAPLAQPAGRASGPALTADLGKTPAAQPRPGDFDSLALDDFDHNTAPEAVKLADPAIAPQAQTLESEECDTSTHRRHLYADAKHRFELHGSVWDAALFIGSPQLSVSDSILVSLLLIVNAFVLAVFLGIVYHVFAQENFTPDLVRRVEEWRINFGHNIKYYDENTMTSLTERVCAPDAFQVEMSSQTSTLVKQIQEYIGTSTVFNGPSLVTVSLLLWALTVVSDLTQIWDLSRALRSLPSGTATVVCLAEIGGTALKLACIAQRRRVWLLTIILSRAVSSLTLWILGNRFLCSYSISTADILLNAVALEIVLTIDEALFILAPWRVKTLISRLEPLPSPARLCRAGKRDLRPYVFLALVAINVGVGSFITLQQVRQTVLQANATLCSGVKDFVYSTDAFHQVYTSPSNPVGMSASQIAMFAHVQAIRETIFPETVPLSTRYNITLPHKMSMSFQVSPLEEVKKRAGWDVAESSAGVQLASGVVCNDTIALKWDLPRFIHESLDAFSVGSLADVVATIHQVETCADIEQLCKVWPLVRAACPETCGCSSPAGELFLTDPVYGCPQACPTTPWYLAQQTAMPCVDPTPEELRANPVWISWGQQFAQELRTVFQIAPGLIPCKDCAALFTIYGCGVIQVWIDLIQSHIHVKVDPCSGNWLNAWLRLRPASTFCPVACGCAAGNGTMTLADVLAAGCAGGCATAP